MSHYDKFRYNQQSPKAFEEAVEKVKKKYKKTLEKLEEVDDVVNSPKHYTSHPSGIETIQITEHMNFNLGNVIKYVMRHEHKNGLEDLRKALWYLGREINRLESKKRTRGLCAPSMWVGDNDESS